MLDKLRLLNPFTPIVSAEDASDAARAGAVGAFGSVISGVLGVVQFYLLRDQILAIARQSAEASATNPEAARQATASIEGVITYMPIITMSVVTLIYLVFGLIQWRKRTMAIPLVMFLFSAYGVVMGLISLLTRGARVSAMSVSVPLWWQMGSWTLGVILMALFWAGVRGGNRFKKIGGAPDISTF